jgi:glycosyltransferase involved in cell wall biosynthesis
MLLMRLAGFTKYLTELRENIDLNYLGEREQLLFQKSANSINPYLTNLQFLIYFDRLDLQSKFDITGRQGLENYIKWFDEYSWKEYPISKQKYSKKKESAKIIFLREYSESNGHSEHTKNFLNILQKEYATKDMILTLNLKFDRNINLGISPISLNDRRLIFSFTPSQIVQISNLCKYLLDESNKKAIYFAWETEKIPTSYVSALQNFDSVITVSNYCVENFINSEIKNVKHFPPQMFKESDDEKRNFSRIKNKYKLKEQGYILHIADSKSCLDRKNTLLLIKSFGKSKLEIRKKLVIKISNLDPEKNIDKLIIKLISKTRNILLITETLTENDIQSLLKNAYVLISPHRAEGFGASIFKSLMFGVPAIATGYSGNLEFMCNKKSLLLDSKLVKVGRFAAEIYKNDNAVWANVSSSALKKRIETLSENYEDMIKDARFCRLNIQKNYSEIRLRSLMREIIDKL